MENDFVDSFFHAKRDVDEKIFRAIYRSERRTIKPESSQKQRKGLEKIRV